MKSDTIIPTPLPFGFKTYVLFVPQKSPDLHQEYIRKRI